MNENVDENPAHVTGAESIRAEAEHAIASPSAFVGQVFWLVALMIGAATAAGFLSRDFVISGGLFWILFIGWMGLTFAVHAVKDRPGINVGAVLIHAAISGLIISPLLQRYELESVLMAVVITGVASVGLGLFAVTTRYDFSGLGGYLFGGLILLIIASLLSFVLPIPNQLITIGGTVLFGLLLIFDVQRVRAQQNRTQGNAVVAALSIYLDILNLFLFILRLTGTRR